MLNRLGGAPAWTPLLSDGVQAAWGHLLTCIMRPRKAMAASTAMTTVLFFTRGRTGVPLVWLDCGLWNASRSRM
jgi:hypothetical protein